MIPETIFESQSISNLSTLDIITQFKAAMTKNGINTEEDVITDGQLHRVHLIGDKKGSKDGWYVLHLDGMPAGQYGNWKSKSFKWCAKNHKYMTSREYAEYQQKIKVISHQRQIKKEEERQIALKAAENELSRATNCIDHPYLTKKECVITAVDGLYVNSKGDLVCPIRDINNELISLQTIPPSGKPKIFFKGTSPKNGFHVFGSLSDSDIIYFGEGVATCSTIREATGKAVVCCYGKKFDSIVSIIAKAYPDKKIVICCDLDDSSRNDQATSQDNARKAIKEVGYGTYALPEFLVIPEDLRPDVDRSDFNDLFVLLLASGQEQEREAALARVLQQIEQKSTTVKGNCMTETNIVQPNVEEEKYTNLEQRVKELALLEPMKYELIREKVAEEFRLRVSKLDEFVAKEKGKAEETKSDAILFPLVEAWDEEVDLAALLDDIVMLLNKYVSFGSDHEAKAIALWIIHTYCMEAAYISPILLITSPEMRSGKSTLVSLLQKIVFKCVAVSQTTAAALFRLINKHHPTVLCDEADTYMTNKSEDMRCILNAGHARDSAMIIRCHQDTHEPEPFNCFGAKCLAGIGKMPSTVEDRSVIIKMRRMHKGQKKEKMRLMDNKVKAEFHLIQRKCLRFADDNVDRLKSTTPLLPYELNDRAADNWYPLFQIAAIAGEKWEGHSKEVALFLSGKSLEEENVSIGVELLNSIKNIFDGTWKDKSDITTKELITELCKDDESPWPFFNKYKSNTEAYITPQQLGGLLKRYDISSKDLAKGKSRLKGYRKSDFTDAFDRYLCTQESFLEGFAATAAQLNNDGASQENEKNNLAATIRSLPLPLPKSDILPPKKVAVAASSGSERQNVRYEKPLKPVPHIAGAAVAAKMTILGLETIPDHDYIDI